MVFKNLCILMLWTKVASALEGLNSLLVSESFCICLGLKYFFLKNANSGIGRLERVVLGAIGMNG